MRGAWTAVKTCMNIKLGEDVLIVTDSHKLRIAEALAYASTMTGARTTITVMKPAETHGEEPPKPVREAMKAAEAVLIPTSKSLSHTDARREATKAGARIASMPGITEEMMSIGGLTADYAEITRLTKKIAALLEETRVVELTTPSGTNLTMVIEGRKPISDIGLYHNPAGRLGKPTSRRSMFSAGGGNNPRSSGHRPHGKNRAVSAENHRGKRMGKGVLRTGRI